MTPRVNLTQLMNDFVQDNFPSPRARDTIEGLNALKMTYDAAKYIDNNQVDKALVLMLFALKLGIPEPENSFLNKSLKELRDEYLKGTK